MPLGQREGDNSDNRLCGVETEFSNAMPFVINFNITFGGFDFIVAPLRNPGYRPTLGKPQFGSFEVRTVSPFAGSDIAVSAQQWNSCVVGKISSWIDLDSKDKTLRMESEAVLKEEIDRASYLSLQACLLPAPKGISCVNYARCVYQILQGLRDMQLWLRIPFNPDDDFSANSSTLVDSWKIWNSFRLLCEHHSCLKIALDNLSPLPSDNSLERWFGEPVVIAIIHTDDFSTKDRDNTKYLSRRMHSLVADFFNRSMQIVISGNPVHPEAIGDSLDSHSAADSQKHPLRPYLDYVGSVYKRLDPLPEQECLEFGLRDVLQIPLNPIKKNLEAKTYENFEKDIAKSIQYEKAIFQALLDRVPNEKASEITTVLMVVGAGRGTIVQASIQAAKETGRKLRVYAVEKNQYAIVALAELISSKGWSDFVTIFVGDIRFWNAPEPADIMVSDLLGSFGDNELSPEFLDGAKRILKKDGISIPSSYTSFLQPVTASKLYNGVKAHKDISHFETAYVVKMHNVARLAPTQPVFTFTHPHFDKDRSSEQYKKLHFVMPNDVGSAMVHGFAGYFDATLYKDVHLGIRPSTATPNVFSWFPMFFPLRKPICVDRGSTLEVHFWRLRAAKVWYEWCVTSPSVSPIHNSCGRSYRLRL